ncbi:MULTISPECIES: class I adenylate-forming enzyme family protein [Nonomuraea]|uniref:AMP-binding protein n=1 Tax=Nonomuraea ferruginea TaxID=46174 RepID=A0ABT4SZD7_9ACTN|nr:MULTISPECIES: AMP-binding protein [Nonomuraea]MDA0642420.1 AMP-binding protein [Nonomuraea ferruginea]TXK42605.1 long-chain fatty acid--CoA ligase [Nonomuraea sp. C10]
MRTTADFLRLNRRRYPERTAVVDENSRVTYAELADRAYAVAAGLRADGVRRGDTVGILAGNSIFVVEAYLGVLCAGAVPVMYNWRWATPELVFGLNDSRAEVVLVDQEWVASVKAAQETGEPRHLRRVVVEGPDYEAYLGEPVEPELTGDMDATNVIMFTGGTTGFPKGVVLSERSAVGNGLNEIIDTDMEHSDVTLLIAPMFHAASLLCWFVPHLMLGATSVLMRRFDERQVGEVVQREGVTNGFLVPNMVRRLLAAGVFTDYDWSGYRRMYVGGAIFKMPDKTAVRDALPHVRVYYQYGLTEGGPIVTRLRPEDMFREDVDGSIGREFLLTEVRLRALDSDDEVPPGTVGEITVRAPNIMDGYFGRPAETAQVLNAEGWLRTGDLASQDENGYFYYHDRAKDMIKTGGENVYSAEVERVLYTHPGISEAAVIGLPSTEWDEEVCAVVALKEGAELGADELRDYCRARLAGYKIPKRIAFVPARDMPVNDSGKIMKTRLRSMELF